MYANSPGVEFLRALYEYFAKNEKKNKRTSVYKAEEFITEDMHV